MALAPQTAMTPLSKTSWGNFWEACFLKTSPTFTDWQIDKSIKIADTAVGSRADAGGTPGVDKGLSDLKDFESELKENTGKRAHRILGEASTVNLKDLKFVECEFNHFCIEKGSFSRTSFENCRFVSATFRDVKFSDCQFEKCHFLHARFYGCKFIRCKFVKNSASAEHLIFEKTSISSKAFLEALVTNVESLPDTFTKDHQEHRHLKDVAQIARLLRASNDYDSDIDLFYDSHREFHLRNLRWRVVDSWYQTKKDPTGKRLRYRDVKFWVYLQNSADLRIVQASGLMTDWGRSPSRSLLPLVLAVVGFALLYNRCFDLPWDKSLEFATTGTLVFGYSVCVDNATGALRVVVAVSAAIGLFWYSLVLPVFISRVIR